MSKSSNFYKLPKIHKSEELKIDLETQNSENVDNSNPNDLKLWPGIVSSSYSIKRVNKLIDTLQQLSLYIIKATLKMASIF